MSLGGVGRNIAEASHRVMAAKFPALSSLLISPVGYDTFGHILVQKLTETGMRTDGLVRVPDQSAVCNMVLDSKGALVGGVADMAITETITGEMVRIVCLIEPCLLSCLHVLRSFLVYASIPLAL